MGDFRRGFKSWCEQMAGGYRRDLGLHRHGPLDPRRLAQHLGIPVLTPDDIPGFAKKHRDQLLIHDRSSWSAVTLTLPGKRLIITNSAHAAVRQNSDIMHEAAHIILDHQAAQVMLSPNGHMFMDSYNKEQEDEADWLGGALLAPRDALLTVLSRDPDTGKAAKHFAISDDMLTWRVQKTGVTRQLGYRSRAS